MHPHDLRLLLIGPFDPSRGIYSFVAPPLGIWRIAGFLRARGIRCHVFDPNISPSPYNELASLLERSAFDLIGISMTGQTLPHDLSLVYWTRQRSPKSIIVAGGVEATFNYELVMSAAPVDLVVLGEGEVPVLRVCEAIMKGGPLVGIQGTVIRGGKGLIKCPNKPMSFAEFREAASLLPIEDIPFESYWNRLKELRGVPPGRADEETLKEVYCVRLMTMNYCPLKCSFCSYTNFLDSAGGKKGARVWRLPADDVVRMVKKAYDSHPDVRTIVFQDDIFTFRNDKRIRPLCEGIMSAMEKGKLDSGMRFICSDRVDTVSAENLTIMQGAGFRLIGFGVESFSRRVLKEFNKERIFDSIEPATSNAIHAGITPFLNIILSSPGSDMEDILTTLSKVYEYQSNKCEVSIYPYVIPFAGSEMAGRSDLEDCKVYEKVQIPYTRVSFKRPVKILPKDFFARSFIEELEVLTKAESMDMMRDLGIKHLPSRMRALITVYTASKILKRRGIRTPFSPKDVLSLVERQGRLQDRGGHKRLSSL